MLSLKQLETCRRTLRRVVARRALFEFEPFLISLFTKKNKDNE